MQAVVRTLLIVSLVWPSILHARSGGVALDPPREAVAERYRTIVDGERIAVDVLYMSVDHSLDAQAPTEPIHSDAAFETGGWALLVIVLLVVLALAYRRRHVLAELFGQRDQRFPVPSLPEADVTAGEIDIDLLTRLRAESDPRTGLRLVLARLLTLAARENGLALRRHLTTREVLRLLPGDWAHRGDLERLAREVELTVFGGREMARSRYEECLDLAAPHLRRVGAL